MDFYKLLQSAEELLFEVMMWVLLLPRTLWVVLTRPASLPAYIHKELREKDAQRFDDMISPPLSLFICVALGSLVEPQGGGDDRMLNALGKWIESSYSNDLVASSVIYAMLPLAITAACMWAKGVPLRRENYREAFYVQAYLICPVAIAIAIATRFSGQMQFPVLHYAASALAAAVLVCYAVNNIRFIRSFLPCGWLKASIMFVGALLAAVLLLVLLILSITNHSLLASS